MSSISISEVYDFSREDDATTLSEAFAVGGELSFRSGRYKERLSFGGSWYTSHPVDAPSDKDGTGLLGPGQSGLSVLGRAYVQVNQGELIARLYRQDLDLPYLNRNDSRMIPNTFEAYILARRSTTEELGFIIGQIEKMKSRNSKDFVSMAQMAGAMGSDAGTSVAGLRWSPSTRFELSALTLMTQDVFNTAHMEASWRKDVI